MKRLNLGSLLNTVDLKVVLETDRELCTAVRICYPEGSAEVTDGHVLLLANTLVAPNFWSHQPQQDEAKAWKAMIAGGLLAGGNPDRLLRFVVDNPQMFNGAESLLFPRSIPQGAAEKLLRICVSAGEGGLVSWCSVPAADGWRVYFTEWEDRQGRLSWVWYREGRVLDYYMEQNPFTLGTANDLAGLLRAARRGPVPYHVPGFRANQDLGFWLKRNFDPRLVDEWIFTETINS